MNDFETIELNFGPLLTSNTLWSVPVGSPTVSFEIAVGEKINDLGDRSDSHVVVYYRTDKLSFLGYPLFEARYRGNL